MPFEHALKNAYIGERNPFMDYQEVEYIESSGTQYIDTGYIPTIYDSIETKFSTQASTSDTNLYGSRSGAGIQDYTVWINTSSWKWIAVHFPQTSSTTTDTSWFYTSNIIDNAVTLKVTPQYCYVNWEIKYTFNVNRTAYTWSYNAYIFAKNQAGSSNLPWKFKVYYFKIWNNGTLVRDFVPCYRIADSVIWMYDLVNDQFYTNAWSWTFTKWPDVS